MLTALMQTELVTTLLQASPGTLLLSGALLAVCWWFLSRMNAEERADRQALRPPTPQQQAEADRKARAWDAHCAAERTRLGEIAGSADYDAYLSPIRARIAAQNRR